MNWLLIYGHWGFPKLELVGAAISSTLSHAAAFAVLALYCVIEPRAARFHIWRDLLRPCWSRFRDILKLGLPISVSIAFEALLFHACIFLMGRLGVDQVAAYQVALNIASLAFMLPLGLAMAGSVRIGLHAGADDARAVARAASLTLLLAIGGVALLWLGVMLAPAWVTQFYLRADNPADAAAFAFVRAFLPIAAGFAIFDAAQTAAINCLRGLKDVRMPALLSGVAYWAVGFPLAASLGLMTSLGAAGVWWGLLAGVFASAMLLCARLQWRLARR